MTAVSSPLIVESKHFKSQQLKHADASLCVTGFREVTIAHDNKAKLSQLPPAPFFLS